MRRLLNVFLALVLGMSLVGCRASSTGSTSSASAAETSTSSSGEEGIGYDVLRVGMECAYAPSNWEEDAATDTNLPISNNEGFYAEGYDVQIAKILGEQLDVDVEIVKLSWDGLIQALNAGTIDLIIAGMMDTEERKQSIDFTNAYGIGNTEYTIMTKETSSFANSTSIQDFSGAAILGQTGTYLDTVIDQIEGVNHISPVASIPNMIDRLMKDTVDGIVIDTDSAQAYLQTYPELVVCDFAEGEGFELGYTGSCIGVRYSDGALKAAINDALATIDDTTRQEMMDTATANMPQ